MTLLPTGPQYGIKYTLTGPDGTIVTFNDDADPNNVGMLTEITGFDSPDVRENADDLVQMDGGIHGDFFYGRRPITMTGKITSFGGNPATRNMQMTRLMQATNAMRANAILSWTPSGSVQQQFIGLRRQQPLRITEAWIKQFQISMVAADPRIYSGAVNTTSVSASGTGGAGGFGFNMTFDVAFGAAVITGQTFVENKGNAETFPVYTITGPGQNPSVYNATTGKLLSFIYTLGAGETLVVDTLNRTVMLNNASSRYSAVDFTNTTWGGLVPGVNELRLQFFSFSSPASLQVDWRDAWL